MILNNNNFLLSLIIIQLYNLIKKENHEKISRGTQTNTG